MTNILLQDNNILKLIPQREPIVMVDKFGDLYAEGASSALTIHKNNIFLKNGYLREPGLIEHVAQSAAAFAGYEAFQHNLPPKLGYIGEIKRCRIYKLPTIGQELNTDLTILAKVGNITLLSAQVKVDGQQIMECQMKIFLKDE